MNMGISKFTQEIKSEIAEKYKKGTDVILLCQEYGISRRVQTTTAFSENLIFGFKRSQLSFHEFYIS